MEQQCVSNAKGVVDTIEEFMRGFPLANSWVNKDGLQSISHVYSVPLFDTITLKKLLDEKRCSNWLVSTEHMIGIYAEFQDNSFYIYQPNTQKSLASPKEFNQSIDAKLSNELISWASENNLATLEALNFETFKAILVTYSFALSHLLDIDVEELSRLKAFNSYRMLVQNHTAMTNNDAFEETSHLGCFAIIYHIELSIIAEIFRNERNLKLHDVATNTAHFPLLINSLSQDQMFGLHLDEIACSDINADLARKSIVNISLADKVDRSNIVVSQLDLLGVDSSLDNYDIVTANDILEHFSEEISRQVFTNLWRMTRRLLVIHVPFEDVPCAQYGHFTAFDKDKLRTWAGGLDNCIDVTDTYHYVLKKYNNKYDEIYGQFLFLLRDNYISDTPKNKLCAF